MLLTGTAVGSTRLLRIPRYEQIDALLLCCRDDDFYSDDSGWACAGARGQVRLGFHLGSRRSKYRFGGDERASVDDSRHKRRRAAHCLCWVGKRRRVEILEWGNDVQACFRQGGRAVDWRASHRSAGAENYLGRNGRILDTQQRVNRERHL